MCTGSPRRAAESKEKSKGRPPRNTHMQAVSRGRGSSREAAIRAERDRRHLGDNVEETL